MFLVCNVCSNPGVDPLPFFLFPVINLHCIITFYGIITFWPNPVPGNEKLPCLLNPIPYPNPVPGNEKLLCLLNPISYPEYLCLLISDFLVKVTAPNKQFSSVG